MAYAAEDIADELKTMYPTGSWRPMFNLNAKLRMMLRKCPYQMDEGQNVKFPAKLGLDWSVAAIADFGAFPVPADPVRKQFSFTPEVFAGSIRLGGKAKAVGRSQKSTFHDGGVWQDRIEEKALQMAKYIQRTLFGANRTRFAVVLAEGSAANTFTLDPAYGAGFLLSDNMKFDVYTAHSGGSVRDSMSNRTLSSLDEDTNTVTYSGADQTVVAGDHVYITGTYALTFWTLEDLNGNTSDVVTVQGLSRTTYPRLNTNGFSNGGALRNIDPQLILTACLAPRHRAGQDVTVILVNDGQARKLYEHVSKDIRYPQAGEVDPRFTIGFDERSFEIVAPGVKARVMIDEDIRPRTLHALTWSTFMHYEAQELDWWDDGMGVVKPTIGADTYKFACDAYMASIEQMGCVMPIANSKVTDLADPLFGDVATA